MLCFYNHVCCRFLWFCFYIIRVKIKIFNKKPLGSIGDYSARIKKHFHFYLQKGLLLLFEAVGLTEIIVILSYLLHHIEVKRLSHLFNKFTRFSFRIYRWSASFLLWFLVQFHTRKSVRLSLWTLFNLKEAEN